MASGDAARKNAETISVVIAAHNEENVLGACLDALLAQQGSRSMQVVVSANGCTDDTVGVARRRGVTVVQRAEPGKSGALNAADRVAIGYPRIYLDADIIVPPGAIDAVVARLADATHPLAVVPRRRINTAGRPWAVRGFFAINERLPVYRDGLFGRGMITLPREGRARFAEFPPMIADDLFVDSQFSAAEKAEASEVEVIVESPLTTRALMNRLIRVRRGNSQMRTASTAGEVEVAVRSADRWAWLREVVLPHPRLVFAAIPYVTITIMAALLARRATGSAQSWGQDESTRRRVNSPATTA